MVFLGCLHVGDKVLLVENKSMVAVTHSEAVGILKKAVEMDKVRQQNVLICFFYITVLSLNVCRTQST